MSNVVECRDLTKTYGSISVVDGLDLTVRAGQVFGFVGPNGAGKTTTMRMLVGLVHPTRGQITLNGRPLPDPEGLDRVGVMIEEPLVLRLHVGPNEPRDAGALRAAAHRSRGR